MLYDYQIRVKEFITNNFVPGTPRDYNIKLGTSDLLGLLFQVFPINSITDFELNEIMDDLGYTPYNIFEEKENKKEIGVYWLLSALPNL